MVFPGSAAMLGTRAGKDRRDGGGGLALCVLCKVSKPVQGPGRQVAGLGGEAPVLVPTLTPRVSRQGCALPHLSARPGCSFSSRPLTLSCLSVGTQRPSLLSWAPLPHQAPARAEQGGRWPWCRWSPQSQAAGPVLDPHAWTPPESHLFGSSR